MMAAISGGIFCGTQSFDHKTFRPVSAFLRRMLRASDRLVVGISGCQRSCVSVAHMS